jgi:hypothetical protein
MKTALYMEDGLEQVVLTPEGETERAVLARLHDGSRSLAIRWGSFYECRGGWVRQGTDDISTIIVMRRVEASVETLGENTTP